VCQFACATDGAVVKQLIKPIAARTFPTTPITQKDHDAFLARCGASEKGSLKA
jgi:hypothetical protein